MKQKIDYHGYDTLLQLSDWRFSAAALGLWEYLDFCEGKYERLDYTILSAIEKSDELPNEAIRGIDGILYHSENITEERYLDFVEYKFKSEMTHCRILDIINSGSFDDENIKKVNDMVKSKSVLKNLLGKVKFNSKNSEQYSEIIEQNRYHIIKEIYRYSPMMYRGFNNTNLLFTSDNPHCRLQGYNVDEGRKSKYVAYAFDKDTFVGNDCTEFDFIPFAFSHTREGYFVNNNFDLETLKQTNRKFMETVSKSEEKNSRTKLYLALKNSADYIGYDVEIIIKPRDDEQYHTLFVRADRLKALQKLQSGNLKFNYKITDDYYFNLENEVYNRCLNNESLDSCIEFMLRLGAENTDQGRAARIQNDKIIDINENWKGESRMSDNQKLNIKSARAAGYSASQWFMDNNSENKLKSYKQKLISSIVAHDYDRMNEILLNLSSYTNKELTFAYQLFEDPENNIGLAYAFANALTPDVKNFNKKENE